MNGRRWKRDAGLGLIITPAIMFGLLIYGAIMESRLLVERWDIYLLFVALPVAAGIALLWSARRLRAPR